MCTEAEKYILENNPELLITLKSLLYDEEFVQLKQLMEAYANQSKPDVSNEMNAIEYAKTHHLENHLITYERLAEMLTDFATQSKLYVSDEDD